jgi:hypothetical protein
LQVDRFGLPLSTPSALAAEQYGRYVDATLASSAGAEDFLAASSAADEGFALACIAKAYSSFVLGDVRAARGLATDAVELARGATEREISQVAALAALIAGEATRSVELSLDHVRAFPLDALVVFLTQFRLSFSGRRTWKQDLGALTEQVAPHYGRDEWSIMTMRAFRAEEDRDIDRARDLAMQALDLHDENARGAHVLAHTYFESAGHEEGKTWLRSWLSDHAPQLMFAGHLWWHVALHQLALDDPAGATESLHEGIALAGQAPFRVPDVASLLWRMELYGMHPDATDWRFASDFAAEVVTAPRFGFVDAHVVMAHAGARDVDRLEGFVDQLERQARGGNEVVRDVVLPASRGIGAYASGDMAGTIENLQPLVATDDLVRLGGSNAQREVFEDTLIAALVARGDQREATDLLDQRLARRPSHTDAAWLASIS